MTRSGLALVALGVLLATPSMPAEAQGIRGLIKKKAEQAVKGPEAAKAEETPSALRDPDVIPVSEESIEHFKRGLNVEIAERAALTKFLAGVKTREQYQACSNAVAMTPEAQKISMRVGELPENATQAQLQAVMVKMNEDMIALLLKQCGEDPAKYLGNWRADRLREIEAKAAAAAGPASGDDMETALPVAAEDLEGDVRPFGPVIAPVTTEFAGMTPRQYALYKERAIAFCRAVQNGWVPPNTPIVKMPGTGNGVWLFTQAEVQALLKECATLMPLLVQVT